MLYANEINSSEFVKVSLYPPWANTGVKSTVRNTGESGFDTRRMETTSKAGAAVCANTMALRHIAENAIPASRKSISRNLLKIQITAYLQAGPDSSTVPITPEFTGRD